MAFRLVLIVFLGGMLSGCFLTSDWLIDSLFDSESDLEPNFGYSGPPGSTYGSFKSARSDCFRQSQSQRVPVSINTGVYLTNTTGAYSSGPLVSCRDIGRCLALKGYSLTKNGRFDVSSVSNFRAREGSWRHTLATLLF
jgi:hypothetical protein